MLSRRIIKFILAFVLWSLVSTCYAEDFIINAEGYHTVSRNETIEEARKIAVKDAIRWGIEQIGIRVKSYTEVIDKVLVEDNVERFLSEVVETKDERTTLKVNGDNIEITANVTCIISREKLDAWNPEEDEDMKKIKSTEDCLTDDGEKVKKITQYEYEDDDYYREKGEEMRKMRNTDRIK